METGITNTDRKPDRSDPKERQFTPLFFERIDRLITGGRSVLSFLILELSKVFESKYLDSVDLDNALIEVKLNLTGIEVIPLSVYRP